MRTAHVAIVDAVATRTVRFFEVTDIAGDRFDDEFDIDDWLDRLASRSDSGRILSTRTGEFHSRIWSNDRMMSLSIWRANDDTPELVNRQTAQYQDLALDADQTFSETSHALFFDRNVVGFVRHNHGPFPGRLAQYLQDRLDLDPPIALTPLLFTATMERFQNDVEYARQMSIRMPAHAEASMGSGSLRQLMRNVRERYGDVDVTLSIQVNSGRRGDRNEEGSRAVQRDLADLLSGGAAQHLEKAQLKYRSAETERGDVIDFLQDRIAMAVEMPIEGMSAAGARVPVRNAVRDAYERLRPDIQDATG